LKSRVDFALLIRLVHATDAPLQQDMEGQMTRKIVTGLMAAVLATTVALASPAFARGGGHGGGGHGGFHGGGGWHGGGGMHAMGGGMRFSGMGGGPRFAGARFAGPRFAHAGFHHGFHHRFHHRRFAFFGAPYLYAGYNYSCWRRVWTAYGPRWVNYCDYGYGFY
jgi:hypothetical protein